jgi:type VI protein secretion system component Hcp
MATKSEILMKIEPSAGKAISAECQLTLDPADTLMKDFTDGKFFQIENFTFSAGLQDEHGGKPHDTANHPSNDHPAHGPDGKLIKAKAPKSKFTKWRSERAGEGGSARYPLEVEPVSFSRLMDQASTVLFQGLCESQTFATATIVRRMSTGSGTGGLAFLRLDFNDVLIVGIDWDEEDVIKEKYKFVCRGVKVQYRPQASDGSLSAAISGVWPKAK